MDKLSVIHVAGTKGKGSTCAFAESILRNYGFKTGFYSSPHLIHVSERIRINGRPIKEDVFTKYFWLVYNALNSQKENESDMPTYFKFMTLLMFHIFLNFDIDVVILEVGIGGEYDCTNVVRHPVCVGITSLGIEHTTLLGNTLEAIARQKSGIMKENTIAFTAPQPEEAMKVIRQIADERKCRLHIIPDFKSYHWNGQPPALGIATSVQETNASLAIQLAHTWILENAKRNSRVKDFENGNGERLCVECRTNGNSREDGITNDRNESPSISLSKTASALSSCNWPGRTQILRGSSMDFYLDGAHTVESIEVCATWYSSQVEKRRDQDRFLIFNVIGDRDVAKLMKPLKCLKFNRVYFVPNVSGDELKLDQLELSTTNSQQLDKCWKNSNIWGENNTTVLGSVSQALSHIKTDNDHKTEGNRPQVLVTGSLHLVGAALLFLDPGLTMKTNY